MILCAVLRRTAEALETCADYFGDYEIEKCDLGAVQNVLKAKWEEANATLPNGCATTYNDDIKALFKMKNEPFGEQKNFRRKIKALCTEAFQDALSRKVNAELVDWSAITDMDVGMDLFFKGGGFLNNEIGNFHQYAEDLPSERFLYTGEDPRKNDHYPTSEASYQVGQDVKRFQYDVNQKQLLSDPLNFANKCENQAIMCCWHRDRQYLDNNGNCRHGDCVNKDPADNTNLCWTENEAGDLPSAYPGDEYEGNLHCHGLAWGSDLESPNDFFRFNNLFYVSMYDHMYKRGYVQSVTDNDMIANTQPMCGCVEEMNPVSRADCTEVVSSVNYTFTMTQDSVDVVAIDDTFMLEYQACDGFVYDPMLGPEYVLEGERTHEIVDRKNNDLSAFVFRLYLEGKMSESTMLKIYETVVGYENPNKNENEEACATAYTSKFGEPYRYRQ